MDDFLSVFSVFSTEFAPHGRQATRLRCNCDNGGSRIDVNSGLMADFIDFTIDDQNAVLAGVSIGLE